MNPHPTALSLTICERVIVEERTRNVSLIGTFSILQFASFPATPRAMTLFAVLTEGRGVGRMDVVVTRLDNDEEIYRQQRAIVFPDPLHEVRIVFRMEQLSFPDEGAYLVSLLVDGAWVAHRRLTVRFLETAP